MRTRPNAKATLDHLPGFNGRDVEHNTAEADAPLPADGTVFEHLLVDDRDVHDREHHDKTSDDGEEKEAVAPKRGKDGQATRNVLIGVGIHVEK